MYLLEQDLRRMSDDCRRLREDMLPCLRLVKDAQQPLPSTQGYNTYDNATLSPPVPTPTPSQTSHQQTAPKRQYSQRKILIGATPQAANASPTHSTHERARTEQALDPAGAAERALLSSTHLAAMNGAASPNIPSPTSPHTQMGTLGSRSYRDPPLTARSDVDHGSYPRDKLGQPPRRRETPVPDTPGNSSVEIFKSFRVSMDDPCHKVLPAALKKYNINAPWDQYALYIVFGDQERCLGMDEKPLILFKQLDKEGKKPMFMLRKTNQAEGEMGGVAGVGSTSGRGGAYEPPGGII